ncbi:TPA: M10 family metallopeptidase C-terminal domain-containing protein [Yersinia enterocolitica]
MEEIRNVIDNKLRNIKHATIPYNEKWKIKKGDNIPVVTYSFTQSITSDYRQNILDNKFTISSLNQLQINQTKTTFRNITDITNIRFVEVNNTEANIPIVNFHPENHSIFRGHGYLPHSRNICPILINTDYTENLTPTNRNSGGHVIVHEILHTVGLKHTHETVGLTKRESVMSYLSEAYSGGNYGEYYASTPQLYDIAALQFLYGANMNTRTGNDIYTYSNHAPILCIWDAGGIDTFDFSDQTQDMVINLAAGGFSNVGGLTGNISIAYNVVIENTVGGSGNDKIAGNDADNILTGGKGADHLRGGKGRDIFRYSDINDSILNAADTIYDFESGQDKIDISSLARGNIILTEEFRSTNHQSGGTEVAQFYGETSDLTYLMINFDHTDQTDMVIKLAGKHQLTAHDFICAPLLTA